MNEAPSSVIVAAEGQTRLQRSLGRRLWRVPVVAVAVVVLCLGIGSGVAWAFLTATGTGSGTVTVTFTHETSSTSLNTPVLTYGSETTVPLTGTVTGVINDGYPKLGAVTVVTTTDEETLCTGTLTAGGADYAAFTCTMASTELSPGLHTVHAAYAGGKSSTHMYFYNSSISEPVTFTVATG